MTKTGEPQQTITTVHPGGRPTKYIPEFIQRVDEYIILILEERKKQKVLPTIEGFASYIQVDPDSILNWAGKKLKDEEGNKTKKLARPEFFGAIKRIKTLQKDLLINDGLYGGKGTNSIMAMFLLKVNHNMVETTNVDHTTNGKDLPTPIYGSKSTT